MSNKVKRKNIFLRIYFYIIFALTFATLLFVFPKQGKFKYEYQKGAPWKHETLIAAYDFPILKTKEELQQEKDSLLNDFYAYYLRDNMVAFDNLNRFAEDIERSKKEQGTIIDSVNFADVKAKIVSALMAVYEAGVVENSAEFQKQSEDKSKINVVSENVASEQKVLAVFTLKTAYVKVNEAITALSDDHPQVTGLMLTLDMSDYIKSNLTYSEEWTGRVKNDLLESVSTTRGMVQAGTRIISRGDFVSDQEFLILDSYRKAFEGQQQYGGWLSVTFVAQMLLILAFLLLIVAYLKSFNPKMFREKKNLTFILSVVLLFVVAGRLVSDVEMLSIYLIPFCILPILIRTFLGARMAIFIHLITVVQVGFMVPNGFEFIILQLVTGAIAVMMLSRLHRRGHLLITAFVLVLAYGILYLLFELMKEGAFNQINWYEFRWFVWNGIFILVAYPLIYVFEKIFGFISDVTLMEFSDTNHPLLRKLAQEAPGTFQHSMQVANLAEETILKIGGNPMLVRAGAMYHDVGKIADSNFFIENQEAGQNPHDELDNLQSAGVIVGHVGKGVVLAKKYNVPNKIIDFIRSHHGTGMATYFYRKYMQDHPDEKVNPKKFSYPGPNPHTKETAVVMLADTIEAATRSLENKNEEVLRDMVNMLIDKKVSNHELDDAPLTFRDISRIKEIFLEKLKNIYHVRIAYPAEKK